MTTHEPDDVSIDTRALWGGVWRKKRRIGTVTLALLVITYVILMFVPKMYTSSASILVEPRSNAYTSASDESGLGGSSAYTDETAIASQVQLIQSRDNLLSAIDAENLRDVPELNGVSRSWLSGVMGLFGKKPSQISLDEKVLKNLKEHLSVIREQDSRVITVFFSSQDPELSARVANAIAKAHVNQRAGQVVADTAEATKWLEVEIEKLRKRVSDAEEAVAKYKIDNDLFVGDQNVSLVDQQMSSVADQISQAQERKSTADSRAAVLRRLLSQGQPIDGVTAVQESQTIQQLLQEKGTLTGQRAQKLATLMPSHPEVRALTAQINEIDKQISAEGRKFVSSLEAESEVEADLVKSLTAQLTRLKQKASGATQDNVTLGALEREAKAQRDLLETYLLRYRDASARTDSSSALPDVRITSVAAPAASPSSPKTGLILAAVLIVALLVQIGHILFAELVSGRALVAEVEPERDVDVVVDRHYAEAPAFDPEPETVEDDFAEPAVYGANEDDVLDDAPLFDDVYNEPAYEYSAAEETVPEETVPEETVPDEDVETGEVGDELPDPVTVYDEGPSDDDEGPSDDIALTQLRALLETPDPDRDDVSFEDEQVIVAEDPDPGHLDEPEARHVMSAEMSVSDWRKVAGNDLEGVGSFDTQRDETDAGEPLLLTELAQTMLSNNERAAFIATLGDEETSDLLIDVLIDDLVNSNLSVVVVDASSGHASPEPGLSDLCSGEVGYGDVVHRSKHSNVAFVPWGQLSRLDYRSTSAGTLVEALTDVYDMVLVATGRPGIASSLPLFADSEGVLLVATPGAPVQTEIAHIRKDAQALGFDKVKVVEVDASSIQVA